MRDLYSNARPLWYALYLGKTDAVDENGDFTGETDITYSEPVEFRANLSATRGTQGFTGTGISYDYFGADVRYDLIISTANMDLPIDEHSLIWTKDPYGDSSVVDYSQAEFRVSAVARGLHHMKYAIRSLEVTHDETDPSAAVQDEHTTGNEGNQEVPDWFEEEEP